MIEAAKAFAKRHWPLLRLRTILFLTLLFVAALPGVGAVFLRVYENTLVQQTEAELIAEGAVLAGVYRASWPEPFADPPPGPLAPERPTIDLGSMRVLPVQPSARAAPPADPRASLAGAKLRPIVNDAARATLAATRVLDAHGTVVLGRGDVAMSYASLPEVAAAARGETSTVLRRRGDYRPRYALEWLSRASAIRVHYVRPIRAGGKVIGILMLNRSPRGLFLGIYQDRGKIALGVGLIFATLLLLAGLLSRGIARPIEALSEATRDVARGPVVVPDPPATAALEIRNLYVNFAAMAERIERRSRYLKDFAAAVSHELKTPIAGIKGVLELIAEHSEMTDGERRRFLGNANADADRLSHLLRRLLDLARADMAVAPEDAETRLHDPIARAADAHAGEHFRISLGLSDLPPVAAPGELIETVVETLIENSRQAGASRVAITADAAGTRIRLRIEDDGQGIAAADRERIFEPFHTSRRSEGGSGLGLPIARSLLASVGGTIEALESSRGALFEIVLPARRPGPGDALSRTRG